MKDLPVLEISELIAILSERVYQLSDRLTRVERTLEHLVVEGDPRLLPIQAFGGTPIVPHPGPGRPKEKP